jgi:hypothetical protein
MQSGIALRASVTSRPDSAKKVQESMSDVSHRPLFNQIAVIGVGLIGGSLARACRDGIASRVIGLDVDQTHLQQALSLALVDQADDLPTGVEGADLVVVAVPVGAIVGVVRAIGEASREIWSQKWKKKSLPVGRMLAVIRSRERNALGPKPQWQGSSRIAYAFSRRPLGRPRRR